MGPSGTDGFSPRAGMRYAFTNALVIDGLGAYERGATVVKGDRIVKWEGEPRI